MQHKTELECTIMFQGSLQAPDFFSFWLIRGTGYCGFMNSMIGIRNELWWITNNSQYQNSIKPALRKCKAVTCVGHSMGGTLCDLFTACANSGRRGDPDYALLNKSEAEWAAQRIAPLTPAAPVPARGPTAP